MQTQGSAYVTVGKIWADSPKSPCFSLGLGSPLLPPFAEDLERMLQFDTVLLDSLSSEHTQPLGMSSKAEIHQSSTGAAL